MNYARINGDYYRIYVHTNDGARYSFVRLFPNEDKPYECLYDSSEYDEFGGFTWRLDAKEFAEWMNKTAADPGIAQIAFLSTEIDNV